MTRNVHRPIGLAQLSLLHTPPPALVDVAAVAGFDFVGLRVRPVTPTESPYDLQPGSRMLRETLSRMKDTGVTVRDIEFLLLDGTDQRDTWLRMMEAAQALEASSITVAGADPDTARLVGTLARMTEDGRGFGITPTLEAISYQPVASIAQAADIARQAGCRIVVDTLHFNRYNGPGTARQWDALRANADLVPLLQLCDGPLARPGTRDGLVTESRSERGIPGEGEFDLAAAVAVLPAILPVSVEVPSDRRVAELGDAGWARLLRAGVDAVLTRGCSLQPSGSPDTAGAK
ncbi:sugar phosphate isomerase/epimerase family protein [Paenarthrobacter sp. C1]|uniref:sugar phosphate isomerase/epimerase family protein n=1 Tax=Paenarthrobacter sp. C1 TaxID=3400220 RepID=UPI003BF5FB45